MLNREYNDRQTREACEEEGGIVILLLEHCPHCHLVELNNEGKQ